jgi:hypothetical protein
MTGTTGMQTRERLRHTLRGQEHGSHRQDINKQNSHVLYPSGSHMDIPRERLRSWRRHEDNRLFQPRRRLRCRSDLGCRTGTLPTQHVPTTASSGGCWPAPAGKGVWAEATWGGNKGPGAHPIRSPGPARGSVKPVSPPARTGPSGFWRDTDFCCDRYFEPNSYLIV